MTHVIVVVAVEPATVMVAFSVAVAEVEFDNDTVTPLPEVEMDHKYVTTEDPPEGTHVYELVCVNELEEGAVTCVMVEDKD
jgi:hypothetical protein